MSTPDRPGSLRADAFRGHGLSLLAGKPPLRGLRTRAVPTGVTALRSPELGSVMAQFTAIKTPNN